MVIQTLSTALRSLERKLFLGLKITHVKVSVVLSVFILRKQMIEISRS